MTQFTNTWDEYEVVGAREDLADAIFNVDPQDTPLLSNASRGPKPKAIFTEWQTDGFASPDTGNKHITGDDISAYEQASATSRIGNYLQISRKTLAVGETLREIDLAGRDDELAYQLMKRSIELRIDVESIALENQACVAGDSTTPREAGSLLAFIKTNVNYNTSDGANPSYTDKPDDVRTDGTLRDWTETIMEDVMEAAYNSGANPSLLMVPPNLKRGTSAFTGLAQHRVNVSDASPTMFIGAIDVLVTDFGNLYVTPNRRMRSPGREALFLDPEYYEFRWLRAFRDYVMAKTGDAEKRLIVCEWTLAVKNEKALALAADLQRATS